jgi:hypothetical protein
MLPAVKSLLAWVSAAMKSVLAKAGAGLTTLGLGGIAAYWIAVDTTTGPHSPLLFWVFGGTAAVGAVCFIAGQERKPLVSPQQPPAAVDGLSAQKHDRTAPDLPGLAEPLILDSWRYTMDGAEAPALALGMEIALPGIREWQPDYPNATVCIVVAVGCSDPSPDDDPARQWECFQSWLSAEPLVTALMYELTGVVDKDAAWWRWSATAPGVIDAVMFTWREGPHIPSPNDDDDIAVAAARLELPMGEPRLGRDGRCATLVLHVEPSEVDGTPAVPKPPETWAKRVQQMLLLARGLAQLLVELDLIPNGNPPAQVGVQLRAMDDLEEMIDTTGRHQLLGGDDCARVATGYFISDRHGKGADDMAEVMIRDVLLYGMKSAEGLY